MHNTKYSMKLRYLLTAFVATLAFAVGCVDQLPGDLLHWVSSSYISIPCRWQQTITVKATEAWAFIQCLTGLPLPSSGGAGEIAVTFGAGISRYTCSRLSIKVSANEQFINVTQQVVQANLLHLLV